MKPDKATRIWTREIEPIVRYCTRNYGALAKIHRALEKEAGREINRLAVGRWLHKDPALRHQPLYGNAVLLIRAARKVMQGKQKKRRS